MGGAYSYVFGKKLTPIEGEPRPKLIYIFFNHYRGLIGFIVPFSLFFVWVTEDVSDKQLHLQFMWVWMAWFFLWQPVAIPATGLIPIFFLPMCGILSTVDTARCYMEDTIMLFILTSMLLLLLNNSGFDRRLIMWFMCPFKKFTVSPKRLILKCSLAAFFCSIFCNKLLVASTLINLITGPMMNLQAATEKKGLEPKYETLRYILINAIHTSCTIGSLAILHSSYTVLLMKAMFQRSCSKWGETYSDIFNYLDYSAFAFPTAVIMFLVNFCYHMVLAKCHIKKKMSPNSIKILKEAILKSKSELPKHITVHELLSIIFTLAYLLVVFLRWSRFLTGWADFSRMNASPEVPGVKDPTTAAIFVIAVHMLPKSINFIKIFKAKKREDLPPRKPESAILWWRFVDKNMNYGYIFLFGSGVALTVATYKAKLAFSIYEDLGMRITDDLEFHQSILIVIFLTIVCANITSGAAACIIILPWVLAMSSEEPPETPTTVASDPDRRFMLRSYESTIDWYEKRYLGALGVGMAASFGFMTPYLYTPAYYGLHQGKMSKIKLAKYGVGTTIICCLLLWILFLSYAPIIWVENLLPQPPPLEFGQTPTVNLLLAAEEGGGGDS